MAKLSHGSRETTGNALTFLHLQNLYHAFVIGLNALVSRFSVQELGEKQRRITSVSFRPDGQEVLASYSSDYIYIFDPKETNTDHGMKLKVGRPAKKKSSRNRNKSPQPMKKLRLRGDWSDTGPNSRPETEARDLEERASDGMVLNKHQSLILNRCLLI